MYKIWLFLAVLSLVFGFAFKSPDNCIIAIVLGIVTVVSFLVEAGKPSKIVYRGKW